ncbi:MAG TPA: DUF2782 domain-containing protein [Rhodanobacteraceae bacterium]|nr:DUF2782 domain-containing protein [Rhodanobacteraceae bacterium]
MKALVWFSACTLLLGVPLAQAQQVLAASSSAPPPGSALPPPGINDPGAKPQSVPLPSTGIPPSIAPAARQRNGNGDSTNVSVRTDANGDTIKEYRRNGSVYMVRVTPKHGVTQTYMVNSPNGSLMHDPKLGPVSPVYYDIYKWGGPKKPASSAAAEASTSGQ